MLTLVASLFRRSRSPARLVSLVVALLLPTAAAQAAGVNVLEYQLKAGFLFNFAKFIEWPPAKLAAGAELRVGVVAPDDIFAIIEQSLAGKRAGTHPLVVERLAAAELESAERPLPQIVFLHQDALRSRHENGIDLEQLLARAAREPILVVGESPGFASAGGMIGFIQRGENLRFQVNLASAQRAGLKLSARLSGLAEMVTSSAP